MSVLPDFRHHRPTTVDEALNLLDYDSVPYAGGTELLLAMRSGLIRPDALVDLKRIDVLSAIDLDGGAVHIGGAVTHQAAAKDERLREALPVLAEVLDHVGNPRVRAAGTLGGNLCFAEPKSDVATIMVALEATVVLQSRDRTRIVPISEFIVGPYTTIREPDELLTQIGVPLRDGRGAAYVKYQTMERPTVGVAAAITSSERLRIVIGAVGGKPASFEFATVDEVSSDGLAEQVEVIPDMTGSEEYKRHMIDLYVRRACTALGAEA